jgi:hypothetical protein
MCILIVFQTEKKALTVYGAFHLFIFDHWPLEEALPATDSSGGILRPKL